MGARNNHIDASGAEISRLFSAVRMGANDYISDILDEGMDVNQANGMGITALITAAYNHQPDTITFLLSRGARVRDVDEQGETVLHLVVARRTAEYDPRVVELLVEAGAHMEAINSNGDTPLLSFARAACLYQLCKDSYDMETNISPAFEALVNLGANTLAVDKQGYTARDLIAANLADCHPQNGIKMLAILDAKMIEQQTRKISGVRSLRRSL
jgi:ankyrin repeat protein